MNTVNNFKFAIAAVDIAIFAIVEGVLLVLLRETETDGVQYRGMQGLPGGVMRSTEDAQGTLERILRDKASLTLGYYEQLYTFTEINRDVRSRAIAIAYFACVPPDVVRTFKHPKANWVPVSQVPELAYDHSTILAVARKRLGSKLLYTSIAKTLLPPTFTLSELQAVYEIVRGDTLDKRNFRKKILALGIIEDSGEVQTGVANRPATLYSFVSEDVIEIEAII